MQIRAPKNLYSLEITISKGPIWFLPSNIINDGGIVVGRVAGIARGEKSQLTIKKHKN